MAHSFLDGPRLAHFAGRAEGARALPVLSFCTSNDLIFRQNLCKNTMKKLPKNAKTMIDKIRIIAYNQ